MTTAPEFSTVAETPRWDRPAGVDGEPGPVPVVPRPRTVWSVADLLLVGLVVGLAVAAGITAFRQVQHSRARARLAGDLQAAAAGFQAYLREHGTAPADANPGVVPPGMARYLTGVDWTAPTPGGGLYRWVNIGAGETGTATPAAGMIAITAFPRCPPLTLTAADWCEIDRRIDDGNLATGKFRAGFNGWPILWVRASP